MKFKTLFLFLLMPILPVSCNSLSDQDIVDEISDVDGIFLRATRGSTDPMFQDNIRNDILKPHYPQINSTTLRNALWFDYYGDGSVIATITWEYEDESLFNIIPPSVEDSPLQILQIKNDTFPNTFGDPYVETHIVATITYNKASAQAFYYLTFSSHEYDV